MLEAQNPFCGTCWVAVAGQQKVKKKNQLATISVSSRASPQPAPVMQIMWSLWAERRVKYQSLHGWEIDNCGEISDSHVCKDDWVNLTVLDWRFQWMTEWMGSMRQRSLYFWIDDWVMGQYGIEVTVVLKGQLSDEQKNWVIVIVQKIY